MNISVKARPLSQEDFAPYGDVIELRDQADKWINEGKCGRHHDLAKLDFAEGNAGISLFNSEIISFPYRVKMLERHPLGSQAFLPMTAGSFLVVVADNQQETPVAIQAFIANAYQGINLHRNIWHGVLSPMTAPGIFAVVDRIGTENNLEEHYLEVPIIITQE